MDKCAFMKFNKCTALTKTSFGYCHKCVFYKTPAQLGKELFCTELRLKAIGKWDYYKDMYHLEERVRFN